MQQEIYTIACAIPWEYIFQYQTRIWCFYHFFIVEVNAILYLHTVHCVLPLSRRGDITQTQYPCVPLVPSLCHHIVISFLPRWLRVTPTYTSNNDILSFQDWPLVSYVYMQTLDNNK